MKSDIKSASKRIFHTGSTSSPIMHFSHTLNFQDLYFKFDAELITYANCTFITGAVHVIVRTQKRCCPLVLSEVSHEHSTTADSRSESGSASYITWSPHPITRGHRTNCIHSLRKRFCIVHNVVTAPYHTWSPHQLHTFAAKAVLHRT